MDTLTSIFISGRLIHIILVPVLRQIAALLLAVAIAKDCKARDNGSSLYWGIFTFIMPFFAGIVYLAYSRFFTHRKGKTEKDLKDIRKSYRLAGCSVFIYFIALVLAIIAVITVASSYFAEAAKNDFDFENMFSDLTTVTEEN